MKILILILIMSFTLLFCETIWEDGFETSTGWILTGEFEIGEPEGLGGEHGNPDPASAYAGLSVLGVDLQGSGGYPGDYENNLGEDEYSAVSPIINCQEFLNIEFSFMKWLNVEQPAYDHAYIDVSNDDGTTWVEIWTNSSAVTNNSWNLDSFDISEIADLQENVRIRFTVGPTDGSWQYSGWNIDDLIVSGDPVVYGSIEGDIVNSENNDPVAFAQVTSPYGNALSDESGYFIITDIPVGNSIISVNALGFEPFESGNILVIEDDTTYILCEMTVDPDTPPEPENLTAEIVDDNNVLLNWNSPNFRDILLAYNVYRNGYLIQSVLQEEYLDEDLINGEYSYFITAVYDTGESIPSNQIDIVIDAVGSETDLLAADISLRNFPNPFNPSTTIYFNIPVSENEVIIDIYDIRGQKIASPSIIMNGTEGSATWNGCDEYSKPVSSGIYIYQLRSGNILRINRMILLK